MFSRVLLLSIFFTRLCFSVAMDLDQKHEFLKSFINAYEFNASGRYAHEYHPFVLSRTAKSMHRLEEVLSDGGMSFVGRYVLMGYEANAFERFLPRLSDCEGRIIDDEVAIKDHTRGWALKLHNKFGATSGFLFRQVARAIPDSKELFQHVNFDAVEIYGLGLGMLQEIIFGKVWPTLSNLEGLVLRAIAKKSWKEALAILINFWEQLYSYQIALDTDGQGTQDILFAIENAKFIKSSEVELLKFYTGPDITYPISTSKLCTGLATKNSQEFLKIFVKELRPHCAQNTLYVFRSFVDGVGKSTLLGNIVNYLTYGSNVQNYRPVDNTSSLDFDLFQFVDPENESKSPGEVFIADMPAQMSHFVFKPEGKVYVDVAALGNDQDRWMEVEDYFLDAKAALTSEFEQVYKRVESAYKSGQDISHWSFDGSNPERAYATNLVILKESTPGEWVAFEYNGAHYLAKSSKSKIELRVLMDIKEARSEGLKNAAAAQMIFTSGVSFPADYEIFLKNFVQKIKEKGITQVAFVDFISMYSRSSRENIRINYLLQAICHIKRDLEIQKSTYKHFVSDTEFLYLLEQPAVAPKVVDFFKTEALTRMFLCNAMAESNFEKQTIVNCASIQKALLKEFGAIEPSLNARAQELCHAKVSTERDVLRKIHGQSREYLNVYSLDFEKIKEFSDFIVQLFSRDVKQDRLNRLWENCDGEIVEQDGSLELNSLGKKFDNVSRQSYVTLDNGQKMRVLAYFSPQMRDPFLIDRIVKTMRVGWTFALLNLFVFTDIQGWGESITLDSEIVMQLPFVLKKDKAGDFWLLEKDFESAQLATEQMADGTTDYYGLSIDGVVYLFDYYFKNTEYGFLGLGTLAPSMEYYNFIFTSTQNYALEKFLKNDLNKKKAMSLQALWQETEKDYSFSLRYATGMKKDILKDPSTQAWVEAMKKNIVELAGQVDKFGYSDVQFDDQYFDREDSKKMKKILITGQGNGENLLEGINYISSIFATLHFLMRDPQSFLAPYCSSDAEFQSLANIFRFAVIPQYLGVCLERVTLGVPVKPCVEISFDF